MFDFKKDFPKAPGVYKMLKGKEILYVGKAKDLSKRVASYAQLDRLSLRIKRMVHEVDAVDYIITKTEIDALLLECDLIKKHKPRFNVLFKDDKSFAFIKISKHDFPRISQYRGKADDDNFYAGPFPWARTIKDLIVSVQKIFQLRSCSDEELTRRKRPCLLYHIKRCTAPCVGYVDEKTYQGQVQDAQTFLSGRALDLEKDLEVKMQDASVSLDFEKAAIYRDKLNAMKQFMRHIQIDHDTIVIYKKAGQWLLDVCFGDNVGTKTYPIALDENDEKEAIMSAFIKQFYTKNKPPQKIVVSHMPTDADVIEQALFALYKQKTQIVKGDAIKIPVDFFSMLGEKLHKSVRSIEVYDNSHFQGASPYGVCLVVLPDKFDYKRFKIKGGFDKRDDYAMMRHVLARRFEHQEWAFPDVVLIDGGKGQLNAAYETLESRGLAHDIYAMCITKDGPHKDRFYDKNGAVDIQEGSELYFFLQNLRDKTHNFAISSHKRAYRKSALSPT